MKKLLLLSSTFQKRNLLTMADIIVKKVLDLVINIYQSFISSVLKNILGVDRMCKFSPTCSEYTKQTVKQHGLFGILLGAKRIGACR